MSASIDNGRASDKASLRSADLDSQRPQSSAGVDSGKKKGMGVKDMEQVISTLHKQNFDLKLELFHRREKQTKMEERMETLESESKEMQDMNHKLMDELEKRDKAIEEAVAMIVNLEARVDQLVSERNMVKQIETDGFYGSNELIPSYQQPAVGGDSAAFADMHKDNKPNVMNRMPSFLSERTATTENLRNVYLGARGSILSLRRVSGGPSEADNAMFNGLASPTLSVLSESSFLSVYGQKGGDTTTIPDFDEPLSFSGMDVAPLDADAQNDRLNGSSPDKRLAPSVRQERYEATDRPVHIEQRQSGQLRATEHDIYSHPNQQFHPEQRLTKEEKRAALRRVMTDGAGTNTGGVRLHDHALPPTPDTMSSATLHRLKTSNDTLCGPPPDNNQERNWGASLNAQHRAMTPDPKPVHESHRAERLAQPTFDTQSPNANHANLGASLQRPRSAGETTVSHRRRDSWQSDDSDTRSLQSSLDIWLRQGNKPAAQNGRASPDLFGFPTSATSGGGWATNALFDPKSVASRLGAMPPTNYMHDLLSLREALFSPNLAPLPPNRRSSLYAQSGVTNQDGSFISHGDDGQHRSRRNSDLANLRADMRTPVQQHQHQPQAPSSDKKNYPPSSWQAPRSGINRIFRRSIDKGSSECNPCAMEDAAINSNGGDVPVWVARSGVAVDDADRSGATPPPIMFNPRHGRRSSMSSGQDSVAAKENVVPPARPQSVAHPGVRKWLPALRQKK